MKNVLVLMLLLFGQVVSAQDQDGFSSPLENDASLCIENLGINYDCFKLYTSFESMYLVVFVGDNDIGVTEDRVRILAESRLRAARLYDEDNETVYSLLPISGGTNPLLLIEVNIVEGKYPVYSYSLEFHKPYLDELTYTRFRAVARSTGRFGITGDAGDIFQGISELMDEFINEYLRVNEPACN